MNNQSKIAGFALPHINEDNKINRILSSALEGRIGKITDRRESNQLNLVYWDASFLN